MPTPFLTTFQTASDNMAANDYFNDSNSYLYNEPPRLHEPKPLPHPRSGSELSSIYKEYSHSPSPYGLRTPAPRYESTEQLTSKHDQRFYPAESSSITQNEDHYTDNIPLNPTKKQRQSRDEWPEQTAHYPPSPESQQAPDLAPRPGPRKRGWFSGRVPWVVYLVSLAQVSVFIAEIIKNCKCFALLRIGKPG